MEGRRNTVYNKTGAGQTGMSACTHVSTHTQDLVQVKLSTLYLEVVDYTRLSIIIKKFTA